jgi:hypothetical protein
MQYVLAAAAAAVQVLHLLVQARKLHMEERVAVEAQVLIMFLEQLY